MQAYSLVVMSLDKVAIAPQARRPPILYLPLTHSIWARHHQFERRVLMTKLSSIDVSLYLSFDKVCNDT